MDDLDLPVMANNRGYGLCRCVHGCFRKLEDLRYEDLCKTCWDRSVADVLAGRPRIHATTNIEGADKARGTDPVTRDAGRIIEAFSQIGRVGPRSAAEPRKP